MNKTFIVAELSANHGHKLGLALQSVRAAKEAGADAIKIQTYTADTITLNCDADDFKVKGTLWDGRTLYDLYREAYTPWEWHQAIFDEAKKTVNIDHHVSNARGTGMVNYVVPTASSASELVFDVLEEEYLDEEIAKALYVGIIHDTGVFHYSNTSPKTMQIGAKLISFGFDFTRIIGETFYEKTYHQNQILGRALLESILFMNGQCIVSSIDKKTMDFYEVTSKDMDGIASQLRQTKDVECAIFMYEIEPLVYKVSLRSGGKVDVSKVAEYFGGGGHVRAAGCTLNGTNHDVINNLSVHIEKQLLEAER